MQARSNEISSVNQPSTHVLPASRRAKVDTTQSWRAAALVTALAVGALGGLYTISDQLAAPLAARVAGPLSSGGIHDGEENVAREVRDLKMALQGLRQDLERTAQSLSDQQHQALLQIERTDLLSQNTSINVARLAAQVDLVERRLARPAPAARSSAPGDGPTTTGGIRKAKSTAEPRNDPGKEAYIERWVLREVNDGLALVESPAVGLFGVRVGNTVPGVGRVESIEQRGNNWVVVTNSGMIGVAR